jgi:hypothetical protein
MNFLSNRRLIIPGDSRTRLGARILLAVAAGLLLGAPVAALGPAPFGPGWLAAGLLLAASLFLLEIAWRRAGAGTVLAWMIALALLLRLSTGIGLSLALPRWGYAEPAQQAGYLFKDASFRDMQAWDLARSARPLWASFRDEFATDQYGGLLALSAMVYRYLSPDAHRPFLILILGAFTTALGAPFLFAAARRRWPARAACIAAWIYVLYPDAVFFGASQMREPFLVGLLAVAFWGVIAWETRKKAAVLAIALSLFSAALISSRVAAAAAGFLGLLFLLEYIIPLPGRRWKIAGWTMLGLGIAAVMLFSWEWFRSSSGYDALLTLRASGQVATRIREIGEQWVPPFIVVYGIAQPVLPAAVADHTSLPLWQAIGIFRAAGWYALAPFLIYGVLTVWKDTQVGRLVGERRAGGRGLAFWLALVVLLWLVIAAARGGGDTTDNPRYRSIFIGWMALLAAWAVDYALARRDVWLWRWLAVEAIFLGFFTHWYLARYYQLWLRIPFWQMTAWIVALSGLVLAGGWVWDRLRARAAGTVGKGS